MIEVSRSKVKLWSRLGARATLGQALLEMAKQDKDFFVITADLCQSSGLSRFREEYPERLLNVGIAEQNLLGVAAGMAKDGTNVFATSFAPFITMRACEQVRMNMGYMQLNVKTIGLGSGLVMSQLGNSHYGIEDCAVMRSIPGLTIINPSDGVEIVKSIEALCDYNGPAYLRLTGGPNLPIVFERDIDFQIGKAIEVVSGTDIAIVASGSMVYYSVVAAKLLQKQGVSATVIDMHTIKPIDTECLDSLKEYQLIVTVEEASTIGGLGSAVAEYYSCKKNRPPQIIIGIEDFFPHAGSYEYLLEQCGLTGEKITNRVIDFLKNA